MIFFVPCSLCVAGAGEDDMTRGGGMIMAQQRCATSSLVLGMVIEYGRYIMDRLIQLDLDNPSINGKFNEKLSLD